MTQAKAVLTGIATVALLASIAVVSFVNANSKLSTIVAFGLAVPLQVILVLGYSYHVLNSQNQTKSSGWLWVSSFFLCSILSLPVYWFKHIWCTRSAA